MNCLDVYNCTVTFDTNAKTYDKAMDVFLAVCAAAGIDITVEGARLLDENGREVEE